MKIARIIAVFIICMCNQNAFSQVTKDDLRQFAERAIKDKTIEVQAPSFNTSGVNLAYALGGWSLADPGNPEPIDFVLRQVIRTAVIRKDDARISKKWLVPALERVDDVIVQMLADLQRKDLKKSELIDLLTKKTEQIDEIYGEQLDRAAKALDKKEVTAERFAKEYQVTFVTDPGGGSIKCMPAGRWELYKFLLAKGIVLPEPEWVALVQAKGVTLVGKYRFRVTWASGDPFDEIVEIKSDGELRFKQIHK